MVKLTEGKTRGGQGVINDMLNDSSKPGPPLAPNQNPADAVLDKYQEPKLSAQEWHTMGVRTLRAENEKLLGNFLKQMQDEIKASEERELRRRENGLRDTFAIEAMNGLLNNFTSNETGVERYKAIAETSYAIANLMLEARKR